MSPRAPFLPPRWPLLVGLAAVLAMSPPTLRPATAPPETHPAVAGSAVPVCLAEVPEGVAEALIARSLLQVGTATQRMLVQDLAREPGLPPATADALKQLLQQTDAARTALVQPNAGVPTNASVPDSRPFQADAALAPLIGRAIDLPTLLARARNLDEPALCARLVPRQTADCGAVADTHNLIALYLRGVRGLCGGGLGWDPGPGAHPRLRELAAIIDDPHYFAALERYLMASAENQSFRRPQRIYTLMYLDYLVGAFERGQVRMAFNEFVARRSDLQARYPDFKTIRAQLARLFDRRLID